MAISDCIDGQCRANPLTQMNLAREESGYRDGIKTTGRVF